MRVHAIPARVHGRYLVDGPDGSGPSPLLIGFHGYAERAEPMLDVLRRIRGGRRWLLVSVQALHPFYTRGEAVVANWMTREDREQAIDDNLDYVAAVVHAVRGDYAAGDAIVYAGFSQGVAMAYRAAAFAHTRGAIPRPVGAILLAGDVPPDVVAAASSLPPVLLGRGSTDEWYTAQKEAADRDVLARAGVEHQVHVFEGGHLWDESFIDAASAFLDTLE